MMTFNKYCFETARLETERDLIDKKIDYRILELVGPHPDIATQIRRNSRTFSDEDERKIDTDLIIIELRRQKREVQEKLEHICRTGEMPEAMAEAVKTWEEEVD